MLVGEPRTARVPRAADRRPRRRRASRSDLRAGHRARRRDLIRPADERGRGGAAGRSVRSGGRRARSPVRRRRGRARDCRWRPTGTRSTFRAGRLLARRNASALRSAGRPDPAHRRADRPRRRADRARVGGAGVAGAARARRAARSTARPARRATCSRRKRRSCATRRRRPAGPRIFTVRPAHNPVGPFDFAGGYDDRSHRRQRLAELMSSRLRRRVPPVHRAGRRRERRTRGTIEVARLSLLMN